MVRSDLARIHGSDDRIPAENPLTGVKLARDSIEMLKTSEVLGTVGR